MFRTIEIRMQRTPDIVQTVAVFNQRARAFLIGVIGISWSNRKGRQFTCVQCGFTLDADLNASRNIATFSRRVGGRLSVSEPNAADHEANARERIEAESSCKSTNSFVGS